MTDNSNKLLPIEDSAKQVVELVPEVLSYEIRGKQLRLNFDKPYRIFGSQTFTSSVTFDINASRVPEAVTLDIVLRLRAMLDGIPINSSPTDIDKPEKPQKKKKRFWR